MANKAKPVIAKFNCRIPAALVREVDRAVERRVESSGLPFSRNSYIIEALVEKLKREPKN